MNEQRLPPQDLESERSLLGAAMIAHQYEKYSDFDIDTLRSTISPEMFALREHGHVWQAIVDAADADEPFGDPAALLARLNGREPSGGWEETLRDLAAVGEPANCLFYAGQIAECWRKREIIWQCHDAITKAYNPCPDTTADDIVQGFRLPITETSTKGGLSTMCASDVEVEAVRWLWKGRIPIGKLTLIIGDPGLGKSFASLDIASRVTTGTPWPDQPHEPREPASVLLLNAEDGLPDTIIPRLQNAHADLNRLHIVTGVRHPERKDEVDLFSLARDVRHLEGKVKGIAECRLVILDPLNAFLGREIDSHKDADVRRVIAPLAAMASRRDVAILGIQHLNKNEKVAAIYRGMGSIGFLASARCGWLICRDREDPTARLMLQVKNNLAVDPGGLKFHISHPGVVAWSATPVATSADEALAPVRPKARKARDDAIGFLKEVLADGPVAAEEVYRQAEEAGIAKPTLRRAKDELRIVTRPSVVEKLRLTQRYEGCSSVAYVFRSFPTRSRFGRSAIVLTL